MKELGYDCMGATMMLYENETIGISRQKERLRCASEFIR